MLEAKKKALESILCEENALYPKGQHVIQGERGSFKMLVRNLETLDAACLPPIRDQIKTLS